MPKTLPFVFCAAAKTVRATARDRPIAARRVQGEWKRCLQVRSAIYRPPKGSVVTDRPDAEGALRRREEAEWRGKTLARVGRRSSSQEIAHVIRAPRLLTTFNLNYALWSLQQPYENCGRLKNPFLQCQAQNSDGHQRVFPLARCSFRLDHARALFVKRNQNRWGGQPGYHCASGCRTVPWRRPFSG